MATPSPLRYLKLVGCVAATLVAAAGAVNWAADPLAVFGTPRVSGLNARKPYLNHDRELARFALAHRHCKATKAAATPAGLAGIFGNSRAEIGFNPEHAAFARLNLKAFNHAIPGMTLGTPAKQFHWLAATGCLPQRAIVGVDFYDFLGGRPGTLNTTAPPLPQPNLSFLATATFSLSGVRDAFTTLRLQHQQNAPELTELGFNPLREYEQEVSTLGHYRLFRQRAEESSVRWAQRANRLTTADGKASRDQIALDDLLATAVRNGVPVDLVVYPYHAELRFIAYQLGHQPLYEQWLRQLVATAARHNAEWSKVQGNAARASLVRIWNFGSVTPETLEAIPADGDRKTQLQRYWEAGHFKPALGDVVLEQVLNEGAPTAPVNTTPVNTALVKPRLANKAVANTGLAPNENNHFGAEITPANVDAIVAADRAALLAAWQEEHALRAEVQSLAK